MVDIGLYLDNGKEHGNYYSILGFYRVMENQMETINSYSSYQPCALSLQAQKKSYTLDPMNLKAETPANKSRKLKP